MTDEDEIGKHIEYNQKQSQSSLDTLKDTLSSNNEVKNTAVYDGPNSSAFCSEKDQPVEEPWLLQSPLLLLVKKNKIKPDENVKDELTVIDTDLNHNYQVRDSLLPEEGSLISKDDSVPTIILINSSICTMQRIAVLEDEKLVELLLEPVKSNVQCDSVYLGIVTKFVPHMGGAFVNIGNSRPSLMDIKHNREPFIFSPFRRRRKKQYVNGDDAMSQDVKVTSAKPDSEDDLHNEDEQEVDDFDVSEAIKNINGSAVDYHESEADFEDFLDGDHHLDGENMNGAVPVEAGSNDPETSHSHNIRETKRATSENKWVQVQKGTKIIVQVVKEGLGTKGPTLTAYPKLRSRFWVCLSFGS